MINDEAKKNWKRLCIPASNGNVPPPSVSSDNEVGFNCDGGTKRLRAQRFIKGFSRCDFLSWPRRKERRLSHCHFSQPPSHFLGQWFYSSFPFFQLSFGSSFSFGTFSHSFSYFCSSQALFCSDWQVTWMCEWVKQTPLNCINEFTTHLPILS